MNMDPGFLLINKPKGWTSFDVVNYIRKRLPVQGGPASGWKVGHAGTLDPFATGLLIVGIGREATRRLDEFKSLPKTYRAIVHLGANSNTDDPTGTVTEHPARIPTSEKVEQILNNFIGKREQIPPMFSAKKVGGKRLYKLARAGKTIERLPELIEIYDIKLLSYSYPRLEIEVECSTGTYIRTLARDIGEHLETGAYCEELTRTAIGPYLLKDAEDITK